ncbi:MAG: transposase [Proteobacteria bacterium]|nr:transposase [Pseudomonadota bacterium]
MARKPRIHFPGALYHVMLRGNGGQRVFFSDDDRRELYRLLEEGVERFGHRIHAFCLMSNHFHLAVQIENIPLSKIVQNVSFRYTQYINKKKRRSGHLFQGRYKALLVDQDRYLLRLIRYIHLNPLRSNLASNLDHYPWSSHPCYTGDRRLDWLHLDWVYARLANGRTSAVKQYLALMLNEDEDEIQFGKGEKYSTIVGSDSFAEHALKQAVKNDLVEITLDEIVHIVCRQLKVNEVQLKAPGRNRTLAKARFFVAKYALEYSTSTLQSLGDVFGRDIVTLSEGIKRLNLKISAGGSELEIDKAIAFQITNNEA